MNNDIIRKLPFFDTYYDRPIAPEDNVSTLYLGFSWLEIATNVFLALLNYLATVYACLSLER